MMKWFLAALVAANVVVALLGALSKPAPTDIKSRESNANQIKLAGQGNEPSPLEALTAPKPGSALAAAQQEAAKNPPPAAAPAAPAAPATPPVTTLAAALAPEPAKAPEHKPAAPKPEPLKEASKPMPAPVSKPEPKPAETKKPEAKAEPKPAEVKKPEAKPEPKAEAKPAEVKKPEPAKPEVAKTDAKAADKKADAKPKLVCYQATDLDSAAASKLKAALNKAGLAAKMHETVQETGRTGGKFWVYLPSYANRDEAVKQSATLKDKGFDNYIVNAEGENKNGLSMGLFSQEDSAKAMVKRLNDSGYPAKLAPRGGIAVTSASVRLDGLDEAGSAALSKAGVSMKPVSCKP